MFRQSLSGLRLPFRFDPKLLREDLARVPADAWVPHYNSGDFGGDWRGTALRSATGSSGDLTAKPPSDAAFRDTPLLDLCPYFKEAVSRFECPVKSARLLSLAPGSFIREHSDNALDFEDGEVRLHIPLQTNPGVEFFVLGERLALEEGGCYYVNVNLPHRVNNRGAADRIHLVIDADVNDWIRGVFQRSEPIARLAAPPHGVEEFRQAMFGDEALLEKLRAINDRYGFIDAVVSAGRERGFDFHEGDVGAAFNRASQTLPENLAGWKAVKLEFREGLPFVEWIYVPGERFTEPFFEDSIRVFMRNPLAGFARFVAPLAGLGAAELPAGFIFHMSRCGSTLVSRSLAAVGRNLVISEAPPIDEILRSGALREDRIEWLRQIVSALRPPEEAGPCIVKFDAWHTEHLALIREAFPSTPWVFVYRDPVEVLVSHLRMPGLHMIPDHATGLSREGWGMTVLSKIVMAALEARETPGGIFVNYRDLPGAILDRIAGHFGLGLSDDEAALVREASRQDAKNPYQGFEPDSERKQEAGAGLRERMGALEELYGQLEAVKQA